MLLHALQLSVPWSVSDLVCLWLRGSDCAACIAEGLSAALLLLPSCRPICLAGLAFHPSVSSTLQPVLSAPFQPVRAPQQHSASCQGPPAACALLPALPTPLRHNCPALPCFAVLSTALAPGGRCWSWCTQGPASRAPKPAALCLLPLPQGVLLFLSHTGHLPHELLIAACPCPRWRCCF